jgi:DNA-binding NarL/FixJ family response regulator
MGVVTSQSTAASHRILIVDDHPVVREGLHRILDQVSDLSICGEAGGISDALRVYRETRPDLVITDITLTDGTGLELTKELIALQPSLRILVASMHDEALYAERALRAGARGYISKTQPPADFVEAARQVLAGGLYLSPRMTERMLTRAVGAKTSKSLVDVLSDRELEVFEQIGNGLTTRLIAEKLHISRKTVETHREHIKRKLHLSNATELTQHAVQWVLQNHRPES